jgi:hypothetical protein
MKKSKKQNGTFLELDGRISLITRKKGRLASREVLDGKVMLEAIKYILEKALDEAIARQS